MPALPAAGRTRRPYNAEVRILIVSDIHANLEALDAGKVLSMPEPRRTGKGEV